MIYYKHIDDSSSRNAIQHEQAHTLLFSSVQDEYGISLSDNDIARGELGKPYFPAYPNIHFSLTHCDGLVACMMGENICGIDAERLLPCRDKVARRVFSDNELNLYKRLSGFERDRYFTSLWTLKEAYGKAVGKGISVMREAEFEINGADICSNYSEYSFRQYFIGEYIISACILGKFPENFDIKNSSVHSM